jgi:hypothetical protein
MDCFPGEDDDADIEFVDFSKSVVARQLVSMLELHGS